MEKKINEVKEQLDEIIAGWNGKDSEFQVGGILYTEESVTHAEEAVALCGELLDIIKEL